MAGYKTHIVGGVLAAAGLYGFFLVCIAWFDWGPAQQAMQSLTVRAGLVSVAVFFALWPDIDTNSVVHDIFYGMLFLVDLVLITAKMYLPASLLGLFAILAMLGKHRGWTHTAAAMAFAPLPLLLMPAIIRREFVLSGLPWYLAAVAGYASHLILDGKRR